MVILNWNGRKWLEKFLPAVVECSRKEALVVVADNGSTDDSVSWARSHCPEVRIIENGKNYGFADGYNVALKCVEAEYFLLLNSDVEVTPNWLRPLIRAMDKNPEMVACMPKVKAYKKKTHFEYAGAAGGMIDKNGFPFCRGRLFDREEEDLGQYNTSMEVFWATGAALMIRAQAYHAAGGLDGDFFAHMEEIDLCWRLKNRGHRIFCIPESQVYHVGGGSLEYGNSRKVFLNFRNNLYMIIKNDFRSPLFPKILFRMLMDGAAGIKFLLGGQFGHFWAVVRAHLNIYGTLRKTMRKRKALKKQVTRPNYAGMYQKSLPGAYFLKGIKKYSEMDQDAFIRSTK